MPAAQNGTASARPRPWAGLGAFVGAAGTLMWLPSWSFSGFLGVIGLVCVAIGWRSAPRRWLLWVASVLNTVLLVATAVVWWAP
jgi:hypothetical protein